MTSELRKTAARARGARSRGPNPAEGKRKSSRNKLGHGPYATHAFILEESPELFARCLEGLLDAYRPQTPPARALVLAVAAAWLVARSPQLGAKLLNLEYANHEALYPTADPSALAARVYRYLCDNTRHINLLSHCESHYNRMSARACRRLRKERVIAKTQVKIGQRTKLSPPPRSRQATAAGAPNPAPILVVKPPCSPKIALAANHSNHPDASISLNASKARGGSSVKLNASGYLLTVSTHFPGDNH